MIAEQADMKNSEPSTTTMQGNFYFVLPVLVIVGALVAYKSSAGLAVVWEGCRNRSIYSAR
jgi:hypothetical protein